MWAQITNIVLGVWLMFAPAVLGHSDTLLAKFDRSAGPWVASVSLVAVAQISRSTRWLSLPAAVVLIVAPWFIDAPTASKINSAVVGVAMCALAPIGSPDQRRYGNGWTTLWRDEELVGWDADRGTETTGSAG